MIDSLDAERFSPLGDQPLRLLDLREREAAAEAHVLARQTQAIVVGLDCAGVLPTVDPEPFDVLLTTAPDPPAPWVHVPRERWDARLAGIAANVTRATVAACVAMQVLRITAGLPFAQALQVESLAYSTLLAGEAFRRWRDDKPRTMTHSPGPLVAVSREDDALTIRLSDPANRNAICARMRDALFEALAAAVDDPSAPNVRLEGSGDCFSVGGELAEFGSASDLAAAHVTRTLHSCAALLHRLGARSEVMLHGACIGSGLEVPAAAHRRIAKRGSFFQLPELTMGLLPGAGGTVTLPRAIGRHRTAYMILSARRIDCDTALAWNIVQAVES